MKLLLKLTITICMAVALNVATASAQNVALTALPAGMFDGGSTPDGGQGSSINDGNTLTGTPMYIHNADFTPINGMGYDLAGSATVDSVRVVQQGSGPSRLKDVRVYYLGGSQDFLNVPDVVNLDLNLGGVNTPYVMVKGLTNRGTSPFTVFEIEVNSAGGLSTNPAVAVASATLNGAGWSATPSTRLHDGFLSAIRQFSVVHQAESSGLLSGDTVTYDLGSSVAGLERVGIGQSGVGSGFNDFIDNLTLEFATDVAFTNIVSTQNLSLIDKLPYQQATFSPVTAQYVRIGASSLFAAGNSSVSGVVALSEIQLYTPEPATMSMLVIGGLTLLRRRRKG